MTDTVVIGLGNPLMSDEGIGVRVLDVLCTRALPDNVEAMELGTGGLTVLHAMDGRSRAVCIDCAYMGTDPGTMRRFTPDDVTTAKVQTRLSLHEGDLLQTLTLARSLGTCPDKVVIFGIEPARVEPGEHLSPILAQKLGGYVDGILRELENAHA